MGKNDRKGARRDRNKRVAKRVPDLGYYLIVTDTQETEKNYFEGIRDTIPKDLQDRLVIKVEKARIINLVEKAKELRDKDPQYRIPWIVFDRDQVKDFDNIIAKAEVEGIKAGWSNPCIEIWFFAYFGEIPMVSDSVKCCDKFGELYKNITGQKYDKASKDIYQKLCKYGDEEKAFGRSAQKIKQLNAEGKNKACEMWPGNKVYELVQEIHRKKNSYIK